MVGTLNADKLMNIAIVAIIGFSIFAAVLPSIQTAGLEINATGAPLTNLFVSNGVMILLLVGAFIVAAVKMFRGGAGAR